MDWPLGKTILAKNPIERSILGGFGFSGVFQAFSGSPLSVTAATCQTNPATPNSKYCPPSLNASFTGPARINGKWGKGIPAANPTAVKFVDANAFATPPNYTFGNSPRTAAYNLYGPGNYELSLAMVRDFPLHITETTKLKFRAGWYNVTNHTFFAVASTNGFLQWSTTSSSNFGTVTSNGTADRKAAQFSARIEF